MSTESIEELVQRSLITEDRPGSCGHFMKNTSEHIVKNIEDFEVRDIQYFQNQVKLNNNKK